MSILTFPNLRGNVEKLALRGALVDISRQIRQGQARRVRGWIAFVLNILSVKASR